MEKFLLRILSFAIALVIGFAGGTAAFWVVAFLLDEGFLIIDMENHLLAKILVKSFPVVVGIMAVMVEPKISKFLYKQFLPLPKQRRKKRKAGR